MEVIMDALNGNYADFYVHIKHHVKANISKPGEFKETVEYDIDFSKCTFTEIVALAIRSAKIDIAKCRDEGVKAVLALNGTMIDFKNVMSEGASATGKAFRAVQKMHTDGDVEGLETIQKAIEERLAKLKKS